jgi:tight adherence protein B
MLIALFGAVAAFVAVLSLVLALTVVDETRGVERRLTRLKGQTVSTEIENVLRGDSGTFPILKRLLTASAWSDSAARQLEQGGWSLKVSEYLLIRVFLGAAMAAAGALIFSASSLVLLIAIGLGLLGFMIPSWILSHFRNRRIAAINGQLAETLTLISNSLRSGFAFTQSVDLASKQAENPIREELTRFLRDVALGSPTDEALSAMAKRAASYDLEMTVATILVQRTTGGNLSEILDNVAETIRERERIAGEIRSLTASQRLTGLILSIYPVFLFIIFVLLAPTLMKVLWQESLGRALLAIALGLQVIGIVTIRRILRPEI